MATPGTISQYAKLIDPAVRKYAIDEYTRLEPQLDKVFVVETAQDANELEAMYTGLGAVSDVAEGATIPEDAPIEGYSTTYTQVKRAQTIPITYEVKLFEKADLIKKVAGMAGQAMANKVEKSASSVFRNGFNTSYTSYGDAKPLFSVSHLRADGGTSYSNASSTGITLTEANLEVAQIAIEELLDDRGEPIGIFADTLLVPAALRKEALIITKSDLRSGTADNDINVYKSMSAYKGATLPNVIVWNYLASYLGGSDYAWFLLASKDHKIKFKWGEKPKVEMDDSVGFKNDVMYWKIRGFWTTGWSNPRGVWGSKGDGAAYAS
jgi:hypothetical protein